MSLPKLRDSIEWVLMVALVFGAGAFAQAQNQGPESQGHIVKIGPSKGGTDQTEQGDQATPTNGQQANMPSMPHYWLGLMGGPIPPELRAHLDVPENQGVMVHSVVPDSPAAKAGIKTFDIVLRANDTDLKDIRDLMELVKTAGDQKASISLEVLRKGGRETITVTPAERPAHVAMQGMPGQEGQGGQGFGAMPGGPDMQQMLQQFGMNGRGGQPFAFRQFGPGVVVNGMPFGGGAAIPSGVSVSITKQNDQPAHVTVKRGNDSWEVVGDDAESFQQLPEDLRPFVQQLLSQSQGGGSTFNLPVPPQGMQGMMPPGGPGMMPQMGGDDQDQKLQERLDTIEQQLKDLQQRLDGNKTSNEKTLP
jgi:membrane-associated protease RseP (regulator of RpoE activity)